MVSQDYLEKKPKTPRYLLVSLSALCLGVSYCDRVNLSVAIGELFLSFYIISPNG